MKWKEYKASVENKGNGIRDEDELDEIKFDKKRNVIAYHHPHEQFTDISTQRE